MGNKEADNIPPTGVSDNAGLYIAFVIVALAAVSVEIYLYKMRKERA